MQLGGGHLQVTEVDCRLAKALATATRPRRRGGQEGTTAGLGSWTSRMEVVVFQGVPQVAPSGICPYRTISLPAPEMDVGRVHPWIGSSWVKNVICLVGWVGSRSAAR